MTTGQLPTPETMPRQSEETILSNNMPDLDAFAMPAEAFAGNVSIPDIGFSDFFEQIMMPDVTGVGAFENLQLPPNVSDFTQDFTMDVSDFDFSLLASGLTRPSTPQAPRDTCLPGSNDALLKTRSDVHLRAEAFKKSPWSWNHWIPERNHNAFTGQEEINVQADRVDATDQHISPTVKRLVQCELDQEARDRMIRVVTKIAQNKLEMPSFPSLELLEDLIDVFLLQDGSAIDTFVHAASFSSKTARTELLMAMVSAGSRYVALAPVWKMGLVLQEVVRLSVAEVFEGDNSSTRELQALQAYMLWLSVGVWSGFRRKTEIAVSFCQPIITMLTWANAFAKFRYHDIVPYADDSDEILTEKWRAWLEQEGLKRLVVHAYLHDSKVSITHMKNRLISPAQMMLPLPATLDLWHAPNAHAWRNVHYARKVLPDSSQPSMVEIFGNLAMLDTLGEAVDKPLCMLLTCHALAHEVWQFRQQAALLTNWQVQGRRDRWLAHLNRQRDLLDDLTTLGTYSEQNDETSPWVPFTVEFLSMSLHVSLEDILTFSGKSGEEEARRVYPRVRDWTQEQEARTAVWHAGQVLRVARMFDKTRLRDFYAVALYQATLTLWVFGMVTSNTARKSGAWTPVPGQSQSQSQTTTGGAATTTSSTDHLGQTVRVFLDDGDEKAARTFKLLGKGVPGLKSIPAGMPNAQSWGGVSNFTSLANSKGVMLISGEILEGNFPESRNGLPPLVENLVNLMSELGKLSGK